MDSSKRQYLENNGFIEFNKEEMREEFEAKHIYPKKLIQDWINKYKYYRFMADGQKMFYSEEYLNSHSIEEIEAVFAKNK